MSSIGSREQNLVFQFICCAPLLSPGSIGKDHLLNARCHMQIEFSLYHSSVLYFTGGNLTTPPLAFRPYFPSLSLGHFRRYINRLRLRFMVRYAGRSQFVCRNDSVVRSQRVTDSDHWTDLIRNVTRPVALRLIHQAPAQRIVLFRSLEAQRMLVGRCVRKPSANGGLQSDL